MNRRLLLVALVAAAPVVHSQRIVTVETATELVTPAAFDAGPNDDLAVLDRASGVLRIGIWDGATLNWTATSASVEGADYLGVGNLELPPGAGAMSIAVGSALKSSLEVYTPATGQRFPLGGLGVLPTTFMVLPLGGSALDDLLVGSSGVAGTNTGLSGLLNNGAFTLPTLADRKVAGQLTAGSRVSQGAAFISDGTALEVWAKQGFPNMKRRARFPGLELGTRYAAGHFGAAAPDSFVLWIPGQDKFQHLSILADGSTFGPAATWNLEIAIGTLQVITSNTAQDWMLAITPEGTTAVLYDFTPGSAPTIRQSFSAPAGTSFSAASVQGSGHFILLNGTGGRTTGWQRAAFDGTRHTLSANTLLPELKPSRSSPTVFLFTTEPWVDPEAALRSTRDLGDWTTAVVAGTASALTDLGAPAGLGSPIDLPVAGVGGYFPLPNQIASAISLASLGGSPSVIEPTITFTPPAGIYPAKRVPTNPSSTLTISLTTSSPAEIRWRVNAEAWQSYTIEHPPALTDDATLEAYAVDPNGAPLGPITRGRYRFGPPLPLEPAAFVDVNGNGLSDPWEKLHGLSDPSGDPDHDGFTNLQEFKAGTDPRDPLSVPGGVVNHNRPPFAQTGAPQTRSVMGDETIVLDGSASSDPENQPLTYLWSQVGGPPVILTGGTNAQPTFFAPTVAEPTVFSFQLVVNDGTQNSGPATTDVTLTPLAAGNNLLPFGNAEGLPGGDGTLIVPIPGWTVLGNLTVTKWDNRGGFPVATSPGPNHRGTNFFSGGATGETNTATIIVDLTETPARIDAGLVAAVLSGWLGGYSSQSDYAKVTATFLSAAGGRLESFQIGPVTAQERNGLTGLLRRTASRVVPLNARQVEVVLEMRRDNQCCFNDGYADNLSLTLGDNRPPLANAGAVQKSSVTGGEMIALEGSASLDPENQRLSYLWSQLTGPPVALTGGTTAKPSFTAPKVTEPTIFTFQLVVNDGTQNSSPAITRVTLSPPAPVPDSIFDNLKGSDNGNTYADSTLQQAGRFCLDPQAYTLDSIALLLDTRQNGINPVVQLKIYADDPSSSRPGIDTGVVMHLVGETNPIVFKPVGSQRLVTWTPATPFLLAANRCYWAVLMVESGEVLLAATATKPLGAAGAFGSAYSRDGGATWPSPVLEGNRKMLIRGFKSGTSTELIVNGSFENTADTFVANHQSVMALPNGSTAIPGWTTTLAELSWIENKTGDIFAASTPTGDFAVDLTGSQDAQPLAGVTQTITTVPGQSYRLSLSLGANSSIPDAQGPKKVGVTAGNQGTTLIFIPPNRGPNDWGALSFIFMAFSESTPISITGVSGGSYLALDNVSVVPSEPPEGLGVVFVDQFTQKLQLKYPTEAGRTYVLESLPELTAGSWEAIPGTTQLGTGSRNQMTIPFNINEPYRFYRVRRLP